MAFNNYSKFFPVSEQYKPYLEQLPREIKVMPLLKGIVQCVLKKKLKDFWKEINIKNGTGDAINTGKNVSVENQAIITEYLESKKIEIPKDFIISAGYKIKGLSALRQKSNFKSRDTLSRACGVEEKIIEWCEKGKPISYEIAIKILNALI